MRDRIQDTGGAKSDAGRGKPGFCFHFVYQLFDLADNMVVSLCRFSIYAGSDQGLRFLVAA